MTNICDWPEYQACQSSEELSEESNEGAEID
jgi:hypothetical protein